MPPITAFVAAGFEHSIANLYFLPYALFIKAWAGSDFWGSIGSEASAYATLTMMSAAHNIVVATVGNLIGGSLMHATARDWAKFGEFVRLTNDPTEGIENIDGKVVLPEGIGSGASLRPEAVDIGSDAYPLPVDA